MSYTDPSLEIRQARPLAWLRNSIAPSSLRAGEGSNTSSVADLSQRIQNQTLNLIRLLEALPPGTTSSYSLVEQKNILSALYHALQRIKANYPSAAANTPSETVRNRGGL